MKRSISSLLGRRAASCTMNKWNLFTQQASISHWSNSGMTSVYQTRYLYQAMWHRESTRTMCATAEGGPILPNQSVVPKIEVEREIVDPIGLVSLKVGRIDGVARHPEADMLYVLSVDLGERSSVNTSDELLETSQKRTIISGLVRYYSPEQLLGRHAIVFANLKPRKLRGIVSHGMLLAASRLEHDGSSVVEILEAPATSHPGEWVIASTDTCLDSSLERSFEKPLIKKQKQVDLFLEGLSLSARLASYNGRQLRTCSGGEVTTRTLLTGVVG